MKTERFEFRLNLKDSAVVRDVDPALKSGNALFPARSHWRLLGNHVVKNSYNSLTEVSAASKAKHEISKLIVLLAACLLLAPGYSAKPETGTLAQCQALIDAGRLPEAEKALHVYVDGKGASPEGHFLLGYVFFREAKARESLAEYTAGAAFRKPTAAELRVVGADYVILGDYADADKWFSKSVEWEPSNLLGWYYLARTKYNENRFDEAVAAFGRCLKLDPQNIKAEDNLGLSYQALGRRDEARSAFHTAIDWQSHKLQKEPGPFIDMGLLLIEQMQPAQAVPFLKQAIEIAPEDAKAHQALGKAYLSLSDLGSAERELRKAAELAPGDARVYYLLGQLYQKQGLAAQAKQQFDKFSELSGSHSTPESPESYPVEPH